MKHADEFGLSAKELDVDLSKVVSRSRGVADGMSSGIQFLMKKNKIDVINGFGKLKAAGKVEVTTEDGSTQLVEGKNIIVATGARSRELPNLPQDGKKIIGYREEQESGGEGKGVLVTCDVEGGWRIMKKKKTT